MDQARRLIVFERSIKSSATLKQYNYQLRKFQEMYKLRSPDSICEIERPQLQIMLEDFVMSARSRGVSRGTIAVSISALQSLLQLNDIELNWKKICKLLPAQIMKTGKRAWRTEQIQQMLSTTQDLRGKALVHILASTGIRIGAIPGVKLKHLKEMPNGCYAVCVYAGELEEYWVFLTPEASNATLQYLQQRRNDGEHVNPESPIIREVYQFGASKAKAIKKSTLQAMISRIIHRAKLRVKNAGKRHDIQQDHGFRKRFNTILKTTPGIQIHIAEKMMGHFTSIPLDESYLDVELNTLFQEFYKAVPFLTVDSSARKDVELAKERAEKTELQKQRDDYKKMSEDYARLAERYRSQVANLDQRVGQWVRSHDLDH